MLWIWRVPSTRGEHRRDGGRWNRLVTEWERNRLSRRRRRDLHWRRRRGPLGRRHLAGKRNDGYLGFGRFGMSQADLGTYCIDSVRAGTIWRARASFGGEIGAREADRAGDRWGERIASAVADDGRGAGSFALGLPFGSSDSRAARSGFLAPPTRIKADVVGVRAGSVGPLY